MCVCSCGVVIYVRVHECRVVIYIGVQVLWGGDGLKKSRMRLMRKI